jgi:hypothetical protein
MAITIYGWRCATNTEGEADVGRGLLLKHEHPRRVLRVENDAAAILAGWGDPGNEVPSGVIGDTTTPR